LDGEPTIGAVEQGKQVELFLADGDPLADISLLENPANVLVVVKEGQVVKPAGEMWPDSNGRHRPPQAVQDVRFD
jgi:imidazolonepropionase-like amidohydrolase